MPNIFGTDRWKQSGGSQPRQPPPILCSGTLWQPKCAFLCYLTLERSWAVAKMEPKKSFFKGGSLAEKQKKQLQNKLHTYQYVWLVWFENWRWERWRQHCWCLLFTSIYDAFLFPCRKNSVFYGLTKKPALTNTSLVDIFRTRRCKNNVTVNTRVVSSSQNDVEYMVLEQNLTIPSVASDLLLDFQMMSRA